MNIFGLTHRGVVRASNQDTFAIEFLGENQVAMVVCDGMGGANAGNVASAMASDIFMEELRNCAVLPSFGKQAEQVLRDAVQRANKEIYEKSLSDETVRGMGTTLVAALRRENKAHVVNVGDSRAYLIGQKSIRRITKDHSLVEEMVARGDITEEEASVHPDKNLITRALGADSSVAADVYTISIEAGEYLLLCSDGLTNLVPEEELWDVVMRLIRAEDCARQLIATANERGGYDNITVVLMQA